MGNYYLLDNLGYLEDYSNETWNTHLISKGEHLTLQFAMLLSCQLQLSFLTRQLLLQAQELLVDKHRHAFIETELKHEEALDEYTQTYNLKNNNNNNNNNNHFKYNPAVTL